MRIFVTGADGFIGTHLCERLANHQLGFLKHDLRDHKLVRQQLLDFDPEIIVHLAARTEVEDSFYEQVAFSDINYTGSVNLIESARECSNLRNFVFASTMEVYGWSPESDEIALGLDYELPTFTPYTNVHPNAPYSVAKRGVEIYLEYAQRSYDFNYTAIRQTNCYGRKDNDFFVTEQIITQMLNDDDEINLGYSEPYRNFIYIDDLLDAWQLIIENPDKVVNNIYTLGPDNAIKIRDYVSLIADKIGWKGVVNWNTKPKRDGEIYVLNSNHHLLRSHTGFEHKVSLSEGLDRTIAYWRTQAF
jgi:nucleoside-diphosphate-sugar epimerase